MARVHVIETNKGGVPGPIGPPGPPGSLYPAVDFSANSGRYGVATGDLVTDAVRAARVEGDGKMQPDESVGIYGQRTNRVPNGGFEQDSRYWSITLGTVAQDTTHAKFGARSGRITQTSAGTLIVSTANLYVNATPPVGVYSCAMWLYATGNAVGKTVTMFLWESGGATAAAITQSSSNFVLVEGWNRLAISPELATADRTALSLRLNITGLAVGNQMWMDGVSVYRSRSPFPYVESSEVMVPYAPDPNLVADGDFESGVGAWAAVGGARTSSTEQASSGSQSLKMVSNATGNMYIMRSGGVISGAPLAQVPYGVRGFMYATGSSVGKTGQLSLTEQGGAQIAAAMGSANSVVLKEGWNYLFATGTPVQPDRTSIQAFFTLVSSVSGDTVYVDDIRSGANYVVPTPATVTRMSGRLRVAPVGMSAIQGWVALRVRPFWDAGPFQGRDRRASMPVVLWQWRRDAGNYLRLMFEGGYLVMERSADGVKDTARTPWAPVRGAESLIAGAWTASGVLASAEGRGLAGVEETFASDDFERADGALGSMPVGGFAWSGSGQSVPRILSGRMEPHATNQGNGYAYVTFGEIPYRWGGLVGYTGTHTNLNTTQAYDNPAKNTLQDLNHVYASRGSMTFQAVTDGTWIYPSFNLIYPEGSHPTDGSPRHQAIAVDGDTMTVENHGGSSWSVKHPLVLQHQYTRVFWELNRSPDGSITRWNSVFAQRKTATPSGAGSIPFVLPTDLIDLGSDGATGHLNGDVLWYAAGRDVLSNTQVVALAALGNSALGSAVVEAVPDVEQLWKADDVS